MILPSTTASMEWALQRVFPHGLPPAVAELGSPVAGYGASSFKIVFLFIVGSATLLFSAFLFAIVFAGPGPGGFAGAVRGGQLGGLGTLALGFGFYFLLTARKQLTSSAFLFADGIVEMQGQVLSVIRWDDIESMYDSLEPSWFDFIGLRQGFRLEWHGRMIEFTDAYSQIEEIREAVRLAVAQRQLPLVIQCVNAGEAYRFGTLALNSKALIVESQPLAWAKVASVEVAMVRGNLPSTIDIGHSDKRGVWKSIPYGTVPNVHVFLAVAKVLKERHSPLG